MRGYFTHLFHIRGQIILKTASKVLFSSVVERGLPNNTLGYYSTTVLSSPTLMKSSLDVKKCEQKIEKISKSLTQKEAERVRILMLNILSDQFEKIYFKM